MSYQIPTSFVPENRSGNPRLWSKSALVFGVVSLLMVQVAPAVLVEFSSGEGYTSGTLNDQPTGSSAWSISSGGNSFFTVTPTGGGSVQLLTTASSGVAGYQAPIDFTTGIAYTSYIDFSFVQTVAVIGTGASTTMFNNVYLTGTNTGTLNSTAAGFGRNTGTDAYRLAFASGAVAISGTALGINSASGDTTSDVIRLTYTLQQGASATTWIGTETIYNVTTSTVLATRSSSAVGIGLGDGDTSLYNAIGIGNLPGSGVSAVNILAYSSAVAVPEPTTWALVIVGGLVWVLRRRRLQA